MSSTCLDPWFFDFLARVFSGDLDALPAFPARVSIPASAVAHVSAITDAVSRLPREETLATHVRLFVNAPGGVPAPPYASWYLDARLCGAATDWVAATYAAHGLEADAGEPPDYLGTELEFLYFLARHESAARAVGDDGSLRAILASETDFVVRHVARWVPAFIAAARRATPGPVFAPALDLLEGVLHEEVERLSSQQQAVCQRRQPLKHSVP